MSDKDRWSNPLRDTRYSATVSLPLAKKPVTPTIMALSLPVDGSTAREETLGSIKPYAQRGLAILSFDRIFRWWNYSRDRTDWLGKIDHPSSW